MGVAALVLLGVAVVLLAVLLAIYAWPFPPSLTPDQINGFKRQNETSPGTGTEAMKTFYDWRQGAWSALARGFGALAVALLLALIGAGVDAGKTVKEVTAQDTTTTTTTMDWTALLAVVGSIVAAAVVGMGVWLLARAVQREFADDVGRLG